MTGAAAGLASLMASFVSQFAGDVAAERYRRFSASRSDRRRADAATWAMTSASTGVFIEGLSPEQLSALHEVLCGPAFQQLVRQAVLAATERDAERARHTVREQIRHTLRLTGMFEQGDLFQATDAVAELLYLAVEDVRRTESAGSRGVHALALAADVAAAGVRNNVVLQRIESLTEINTFAAAMRDATAALHTRIRLNHTGHARFADYAELYVEPMLRLSSRMAYNPDLRSAAGAITRMVVLGDPGAGKSTFAAKFAHDVATDRMPGLEGMVPVLLVVRQHTGSLRHDHETLLYYLTKTCRRPYQLEPPPDALEYLLLNGRAVVIVDGVDELGDGAFRSSFAEMVNGFAHRYPLCRILITSRLIGYTDAPLDPDLFEVGELAPFGVEQVETYVSHWFQLDQSLTPDEQEEFAASFMRESEPATDLRSNPLMLSLLCALYASTHFIPHNRPEIYERCAELLFETWDRSRGLDVPHRFDANIKPAVQRMAWQLFTDPAGRQALPRAELRRQLADFLRVQRFENEHDALRAADDFLDFCTGRAWVLTDIGSSTLQPHYGFVHRTFQEFFAAAQLVKARPDPATVWAKLEAHVGDATWSVVALLATQLLDRMYEGGGDEILRRAIEPRPGADGDEDLDRLRFAAQCLDVVVPSNVVLREVVAACVVAACAVPAAARRSTIHERFYSGDVHDDQPLLTLLAVTTPENRDRVAHATVDAVLRVADRSPADGSAGIVHYALVRPTPQPLGDFRLFDSGGIRLSESGMVTHDTARIPSASSLVPALFGTLPAPASAERWRRLLDHPLPADLAGCGVRLLFEETTVGRGTVMSYVGRLLARAVVQTPGDRCVDELECLHDVVHKTFSELVSLPAATNPSTTAGARTRRADTAFDHLPARARATALVLAVAAARLGMFDGAGPGVQALLAAGDVPAARARAREYVRNRQLPKPTETLLLRWIARPLRAR